jgi:hypothetical protein
MDSIQVWGCLNYLSIVFYYDIYDTLVV